MCPACRKQAALPVRFSLEFMCGTPKYTLHFFFLAWLDDGEGAFFFLCNVNCSRLKAFKQGWRWGCYLPFLVGLALKAVHLQSNSVPHNRARLSLCSLHCLIRAGVVLLVQKLETAFWGAEQASTQRMTSSNLYRPALICESSSNQYRKKCFRAFYFSTPKSLASSPPPPFF